MNTIFDIETGPLPDAQLELIKPTFKAPANYKDPEKIAAYISEAESAWKSRAALSAITGRVLVAGIKEDTEFRYLEGDERDILDRFWTESKVSVEFVGFCCKSFDLPFMVQRSFINNVRVPVVLFDGRYWNRDIIDLQEVWLCYSRNSEGASLDAICRACGIGGKSGHGADFANLYANDRIAALAYLRDDLVLTQKLADRLLA